jgi:predicted O-methyltransferase YrrM
MSGSVLRRAASLARVLRRDPAEFADRMAAILAGRVEPLHQRPPAYEPLAWPDFVRALPAGTGAAFAAALDEPALADHEARACAPPESATAIDRRHDGDPLLARCCYALVRSLRPQTVVETGVARGMTSAYILAALRANGAGTLHSIDLPPHDDGAEIEVGALVHPELRDRWQLHRGLARRLLPRLVAELGSVDMFVHDSLHTYRNMRREFGTVWPLLEPGSALVADDIEGNRAFLELRQRQPLFWAACRESLKPALFGVVLR